MLWLLLRANENSTILGAIQIDGNAKMSIDLEDDKYGWLKINRDINPLSMIATKT